MGVWFRFGEAVTSLNDEELDGFLTASVSVNDTYHPNAPTSEYDQYTGDGNTRDMTYSQADRFMKETGVEHVFDGTEQRAGWQHDHPGTTLICKETLQDFADARFKFMFLNKDNPDFVKDEKQEMFLQPTSELYDRIRLRWFEGWANHAIRTCEQPAINNG